MTIEERLEKLENEMKAPTGVQPVVRANKFVLVDESGEERASLGVTEKGRLSFKLLDMNGVARTKLGVSEDGPYLIMSDANDKLRAVLFAPEEF